MATLTSPLTGIADVVAQAQRLQVRILHLGSLLPRFLQSSDGQHRFSPVLFDFRYFIDSATAEARIESSRHLQSLDEEMKGGYGTFLAKLWDLYARAVHLQQQVLSHIKHLTQASQAQQPVSMQLVALLGSVLLLLDVCVPSTARERSIVAHIRLNTGSQTVSRQAAAIVRLFAATGFEESVAKVPTGYPEQYLARCKLPKSAVQILITQFLTLPNLTPSAAASQLYIALYFVPEGLHGDSDLMKAAVSKGFRQSWVITWAPGHLADVSLQWQRYRAARNALGAVLTASKAKDIAVACKCKMNECQRTLNELIQGQADKGVWSAEKVPSLLACIHSSNVMLRWLMLHMAGHPQSKLSAAVAKQSIDKDAVIRLLLDSAYLESWTQSASIDCMAKQWRGHCVSIAAKLDAAAAASVASGPTQYHGSRHQPAYQDAEEQTQQLSQSVSTAELKGLAEQVRTLQVGDSSGVQQLQLALEGIPSSSSSSVREAHLPISLGTAAVPSSVSSPGHSPHRHELQAESPALEGQTSSSPQDPFAEATGSHSFRPTADPWDPWAEPSHQQLSSSPYYRLGSSDSDWDEQYQYDDQTGAHASAHDDSQSPQPDHPEEAEQATSDSRAVSGESHIPGQDSLAEGDSPGQHQNPRVASAMAEAQHRVDQLAGLAASHAEIQETLAQEADLGYAWGLMGGYTQQLQLQIRTDPKAIPKVSALLVKLRSVMTPSLTSLSALEADDADAAAAEVVSHFTRRLLHLAQSVLKVVPVIFFKVLDGVVALHQGHNLILPDRLEKPEVSKYAHLQARAELAKLAQTAAAYSRNLRAFDSDAVAPQKHDAMISLKLDVSQGIAARTARACTRTLTFTQPAASLLVQDPPQAGGLLAGVAGGLAGSSGDPVNRNELSAQLAQLTQELNTLKSSFQSMQDFTQLPLFFIWQQQLKSVMQQALNHELSSLPESVQLESRKGLLPNLASLSSRLKSQPVALFSAMGNESHAPRDESHAPRDESHAPSDSTAAAYSHADAAATEAELGNLTQPSSHELPIPHASQGMQTLPQQATPAQPPEQTVAYSLAQQASTARLPQQANSAQSSGQTLSAHTHSTRGPSGRTPQKMMYSGLPKHADPAQRTFLRVCLAELLRLTNPTQSQFQPLLCGWYTAEGDEVVGLRGFRGLRQALGVTGVRCLDRLLEIRIQNAMRQLSAILVLAEHDVDLSKLDTSQSARSSHRIAPDPAAFKEAVRSGSKLWPIMSHYLAALGQASLIRQRLASDLRTSERLLTAGKGNSRDTDSAPMPSNSHAQLDGKHAEQGTSSQPDSHEQKLHQQMPEQLPKQEQVETSNDPSHPGPALNREALLSQGSGRMQLGISDAEIPQVPGQIDCPEPSQASESQPGVLMLLCVLSLMSRCSFNGRLGILERLRSSQGSSDLYAVMQGLVVWLDAQAMHQYQAVLHTANQYISAYTQVATSATALSVQAAGIQIGLPAEIGRLLAFLQQVNTATGSGRSLLKQFLPPFLLDNWQCLVLSEKGF